MKKWGHLSSYHVYSFFVFSADASKKSVTVCRKYLRASERLFSFYRKCYGLLDSELLLARYQPLKIQFHYFLLTQQYFDIFTLIISRTVTPKSINHTIIWKNSKRSF